MNIAYSHIPTINSIILAAGQSIRMGEQKLLLKWGSTTVIQAVVESLHRGGESEKILIVTGVSHPQISELFKNRSDISIIYNQYYAETEMLQSLQCGLRELPEGTDAFFIALGDQPQITPQVVGELRKSFLPRKPQQIIIPSFDMKRGHPWLVSADFTEELLALSKESTMRDFLNAHKKEITYVNFLDGNILKDLDTPRDYERDRPKDSN